VFLLALTLTACGPVGPGSRVVGGPCRDDVDCARGGVCLTGRDYPDGMCALQCRDSRDCPRSAECADRSGGVCLQLCDVDADCRGGYACKNKKVKHGPDAPMCVRD